MKNGFRDILCIQSVDCSDLDGFFSMSTCLFLIFINVQREGVYMHGDGASSDGLVLGLLKMSFSQHM